MKVLVACEFTGTVRRAFRERGHDAWSCDVREAEDGSPHHFREDIREVLEASERRWDLMIAHPPCTYLANSGARWLYEKEDRWQSLIEGAVFFRDLLQSSIPRVAVENPVMHKWGRMIVGRGPDFSVQPWQFGHHEKKRICLWTRNLPKLEPTDMVKEEMEAMPESEVERVHRMPPGEERSKERSRFYSGVAEAMADQWG